MRLHQDLVERIEPLAAKADLKDLRNEMLSGFDAMYKKFDRLERAQAEFKAALIHAAG
jgi:hypothetical protein